MSVVVFKVNHQFFLYIPIIFVQDQTTLLVWFSNNVIKNVADIKNALGFKTILRSFSKLKYKCLRTNLKRYCQARKGVVSQVQSCHVVRGSIVRLGLEGATLFLFLVPVDVASDGQGPAKQEPHEIVPAERPGGVETWRGPAHSVCPRIHTQGVAAAVQRLLRVNLETQVREVCIQSIFKVKHCLNK